MTSKIETTKREMYRALAALKAGGRWLIKKANCEAFETALEEHLEEVRKQILFADEAHKYNAVLWDALEHQKMLTRNACVDARQVWDRAWHAEGEAATYKSDCISAEAAADRLSERVNQQKTLIAAQRQAIGQMYMLKRTMSRQIMALVEEIDVLKMANKVAGAELRAERARWTPEALGRVIAIPHDLLFPAKQP